MSTRGSASDLSRRGRFGSLALDSLHFNNFEVLMFIDLRINNVAGATLEWNSSDIVSYKERNNKVSMRLEEYLLDGGNVLDAAKIQEKIFPKSDIDVFISHSHADENQAIGLALSLESIGLKPFVDSCTWGYADELLRKIDEKFSKPEGWTSYSYELRNRTTTNVHLILNAALQQMINESELFVFLGTENSVRFDEHVSKHKQLSSPWIFSELTFVKNVKRTPRKQRVISLEHGRAFDHKKGAEFRFPLPESSLSIDFSEFSHWLNKADSSDVRPSYKHIKGLEHLDLLYRELGVDSKLLDAPRTA